MEGCLFFTNDPEPKTELEKLPPATQTGKNTFGCLVNGKAWVAPTTIDVNGVYQQGILSLGADVENSIYSMGIVLIEDGTVLNNGTYSLTLLPNQFADYYDFSASCFYEKENTFEGTITIIKFDKVNYIISGSFEFSTGASGCDTIRVTDGRFDIRYVP